MPHKRCLNFVFLGLFKDQYEQNGVQPVELHFAAMFFYELIMSHKLSIRILNELLSKYNFTGTQKVKNHILVEIILTEALKTYQQNGHLVFLVSLASHLEDETGNTEEYRLKFQQCLERMVPLVADLSLSGLENLASWVAHFKTNRPNLSLGWLKEVKSLEKGKFLISRVLKNLMQLSSFKKFTETPGLSDFLEFFPVNPQSVCELVNTSHVRHPDHQILLDKFSQEISGEEMIQFLGLNELSCYGPELQDVFMQTLLEKSQYSLFTRSSLSDLSGILDRYDSVIRDFLKKGEQSQMECLKTIEKYWAHSQFHVVVVFEKLIRRELIHIKVMSSYLIERLAGKRAGLEESSVRGGNRGVLQGIGYLFACGVNKQEETRGRQL